MNTETKTNEDLELTPQQIQLMQQMEQQNNYSDELKDFASKIANQIENEKNVQQEQKEQKQEEIIPVDEKISRKNLVDKILLHGKEPLFVSAIIFILSLGNNVLNAQISKIMPKFISGNNLNIISMLIISLLGGVLYYIGKKCFLDKKNII